MLLGSVSEINPGRTFNGAYIVFDIIFLAFFVFLLIFKKKYLTLIWALFGGLLYLAVDFGIFYCATHTRVVTLNGEALDAAGHFWFLLWFSFSYGIPNFTFIWLALSKDKHFWLYTILTIGWWFVVPSLSQFGNMDCFKNTFMGATITTTRQTGNFHWVMAAFLIVGYGALIAYYLIKDRKNLKQDIKRVAWLNLIGICCQLMWELPLLLYGIRPYNDTAIQTLVINSLIETNSGMVYFYLLHKLVTGKIGEDLKRKPKEIPVATEENK